MPCLYEYVDIRGYNYNSHKGSFKCYVTLEGVGGCMSKRYEALRGGVGGGYVSVT